VSSVSSVERRPKERRVRRKLTDEQIRVFAEKREARTAFFDRMEFFDKRNERVKEKQREEREAKHEMDKIAIPSATPKHGMARWPSRAKPMKGRPRGLGKDQQLQPSDTLTAQGNIVDIVIPLITNIIFVLMIDVVLRN
jgi:hypothetical protein